MSINKPFIIFNSETDTGVDDIPINSYVQIHSDGTSSKLIYVKSVDNLTNTSTVSDLLALTSQYDDILTDGASSTAEIILINDPNPTLSGDLDADDKIISDTVLYGTSESFNDIGSISTNTTIDFSTFKTQQVTVTAGLEIDLSVDSARSDGWDIYSISRDAVGVSVQNTVPSAIFLKPDGTVLYEADSGVDKIHQHTLNTPWDITSIVYDTVGVATQNNIPGGIFFKPDGTVLYELGNSFGKFYSHTLNTPWDITSITYDTVGVAAQDASPSDIFFKPDGTVLYELGSTDDKFYQHTLSTPWDITSITLGTVGVATTDAVPHGMFFKLDGTVLYEVGSGNDKFYQHTLSTPWDITSYTKDEVGVDSSDWAPTGMHFKPDGTVLYEIGSGEDKFYQHKLGTNTKEELTLHLYGADVNNISFADNITWKDEMPFFGSGLTIIRFVTYDNGINYHAEKEYGVREGWDIYNMVLDTVGVDSTLGGSTGLFFKPDGTVMYEIEYHTQRIYQHALSTPWDITSYIKDTVGVGTQGNMPEGIAFNLDGTILYEANGADAGTIFQHTLSTPWDITSITYDTVGLNSQDNGPTGIFFKPDGTVLYEVGTSTDKFFQHTLNTPWDIYSISRDTVGVTTQDIYPHDMFIKPDGTILYEAQYNQRIYQHTLSTPWDITSITRDTVGIATQDIVPLGIFFKPDGTALYEAGNDTDKIYQHTLRT